MRGKFVVASRTLYYFIKHPVVIKTSTSERDSEQMNSKIRNENKKLQLERNIQ
jgi:hypothetical protein